MSSIPMQLPRSSYILTFERIGYEVRIKHGELKGQTKGILHEVSGCCHSGRLTALMGPSGAGKTSLLDILADAKLAGVSSGTVYINGAPRTAETRNISAYVQQKDVLVPSATVQEALTTSALLKLPYSWSRQQKLQRVDELLKSLELTRVASTLIGDEAFGIKGISGGEKRRVSVGIELVKDPTILFLDEPTTGLDSEMALGVMTVLRQLALGGKMVVCTIHQPNSDITDQFHDWMLLARGHLLYGGPWQGAVSHFEGLGYPCPMYKNPTDVFMNLASDPGAIQALTKAFQKACPSLSPSQDLKSLAAEDLEAGPSRNSLLPPAASCPPSLPAASPTQHPPAPTMGRGPLERCPSLCPAPRASCCSLGGPTTTPMWYQIWVLMLRFFRSWMRTPVMIAAELAQYVVLSIFLGLLYLKSSNTLPDGPADKMGAVFLALSMLAFTPSYTALVVWDSERHILRREAASGSYSRGSFFLAKTLTTAPVEIVQITAYVIVLYFMFGFQLTATKFLVFWVTMLLFALCSETIGYLCAIVTPDSKMGVAVATVLLVVLLSFSGFLVRQIPVYFAWIAKISYYAFATDILVTNEFQGLLLTTPNGDAVDAMAFIPGAMRTGLSMPQNLGVLLGITVGCRVLAWTLLELVAAAKCL